VSIKQKDQDAMVLCRYGIISPLLLSSDERTVKARLEELAGTIWRLPDGTQKRYGLSTIEGWLYAYRAKGLDALRDQPRRDKGMHKVIGPELAEAIDRHLEEHPRLKTVHIIEDLKEQGLIVGDRPSASSIYRYVRPRRSSEARRPRRERRSFEAPYAGALWQMDVMYGSFVPVKGSDGRQRRQQTYLVACIDDHSRLCCHGQFYLNQGLGSIIDTFSTACRKRGVPEQLYCDNGQVFVSPQFRRVAAEVGTVIAHTRIRDCQAKGKVERYFQTVQSSFLTPLMELHPPKGLTTLNESFWQWMESAYNNKLHSSLGETPIERWLKTAAKMRLLPVDRIHEHLFLLEAERKVRNDGTFPLLNRRYETDWALGGQRVRIRYDSEDLKTVFVFHERRFVGIAKPLDRDANYRLPRNRGKGGTK